jgi:DNA ligase-1
VTEEDLLTNVCICAFDLLHLEKQSLIQMPYFDRRSLLHQSFKEVEAGFIFARYKDINNGKIDEIKPFLKQSVEDNCEGLMLKNLHNNATYEPSKRSANWFKMKKDYLDSGSLGDSLDLVVVGADYGKGKRAGYFGSFLLACYDPNSGKLQTVTKVATGLTEELLKKLTEELKPLVSSEPPDELLFKTKNVDVWLNPKAVWEIRCADLSLSPTYCASIAKINCGKGIALRFPRFVRERNDKTPRDATTSDQLLEHFHQFL